MASMRPGQSCPGVDGVEGDETRTAGALQKGRGNHAPEWNAARPPIHSGQPSFNEAGAIMPRSGPDAPPDSPGAPVASMRPGQSCPGVDSR